MEQTKIGLERLATREEQGAYMRNFENFLQYYRVEDMMLFHSHLTSENAWYIQSKSYDDYYICCFSVDNYDKETAFDEQVSTSSYIDCRNKEILRRFKQDLGQLKRPLGLYLEYALVKEFDFIPNTAKRSTGAKAWDFKLGKDKVDFKSCFFRPYVKPNNVSIYNRSYVLTLEDVQTILSYVVVGEEQNIKEFKELLNKIKKTIVSANN